MQAVTYCFSLALFFASLTAEGIAAETTFSTPTVAGKLEAPPKSETSGLAASRRTAGLLWTHDDSGGEAALYGVRTTGAKVATLRLRGVKNEDWEDVAAYERDGKAWLLVGDVGDNDAKRPTILLHLIEEPGLDQFGSGGALTVTPIRTLRVRYEDGPRDCESVAVDVAGRAIYLLTKRDRPGRLYRLDLDKTDGNAITVARYMGSLSALPQPTAAQQGIKSYLGRRRAEICAMDFASDGSAAVVLTYGGVLLFPRAAAEPWADALARAPMLLPTHDLIQAEAACFTPDGRAIYVAAEGNRSLLRYDRQ